MTDSYATARILYERGKMLMKERNVADAIEALAASSKLAPHFKTLELLGESLIEVGQWLEAVVPLAAATTLNHCVRAPSLLADVFLQLEDWVDAESLAVIALSRDPNNKKALYVLEAVKAHKSRT